MTRHGDDLPGNGLDWRRATRVTPGLVDAVEVAASAVVLDGRAITAAVVIRSTLGPTLSFTPGAWEDFTAGVKRGEFDLPRLTPAAGTTGRTTSP